MGKTKYTYRSKMRIRPEDVDRMEIYMFQLSNWVSVRKRKNNKKDNITPVMCLKNKYVELTLEQIKEITFEVSRLETFIEMYDSMVGGRGLSIVVKNTLNGDIFSYGNYKVMSLVTGIGEMKIQNASRRGSMINDKYLVKSFKYGESVPINQIKWKE